MPPTVAPTFRLREVRDWCACEAFHPSRGLGQNFLIDGNLQARIVETTGCGPNSRVVEIGPGLGALTRGLLETGAWVTAIETDARLCALLRARWDSWPNFKLIEADALTVDLDPLLDPALACLVSNLPYSVGTRILMRFVRHPRGPARMVVTVQTEVAERLAAAPGTHARGLAGVWAQRHYEVRVLRRLSPGCFWPQPAVQSALVSMTRHQTDQLDSQQSRLFDLITRHAFMHRRKQLLSLWRLAPAPLEADDSTLRARFAAAGVSPDARPEMLDLTQWRALARTWSAALNPRKPEC